MLTSTINPYPAEAPAEEAEDPHTASTAPATGTTSTANANRCFNTQSGNLYATHSTLSGYRPGCHRRKTRSEDLHILSHAQGQLRSHLEPSGSETYALQNPSQLFPPPDGGLLAQSQFHTHAPSHQRFPNAQWYPQGLSQGHQHHAATRPHSAHTTKPDLRTPVTNLPFRWWERGLLSDPFSTSHSNSLSDEEEEEEEDVRESIEPADGVVQSIEVDPPSRSHHFPNSYSDSHQHGHANAYLDSHHQGDQGYDHPISPMDVEIKSEPLNESDEERLWDEAQKHEGWRGYVQHKESWVRRAGLKRESNGVEGGGGKRSRAG